MGRKRNEGGKRTKEEDGGRGMIQLNITVWNREKGFSAFDEIDLADVIADFMGVEYEDIELDWEFGDEEEEE